MSSSSQPDKGKHRRRTDSIGSSASSDCGGAGSCLICLGSISDRTVLPRCLHSSFCFVCILRWAALKSRCPLCQRDMGDYVIHGIRADDDYIKHRLTALSGPDRVDAAAEFRSSIYRSGRYVCHVASNRHTGYRPVPTEQIHTHLPRIAAFLQRDLAAWPDVDRAFLTDYILAIIKSIPLRDERAVNLVAEFIGPAGAQHLAHELDAFIRSRKVRLQDYDRSPWVQYPPELHYDQDDGPQLSDRDSPSTESSASPTPDTRQVANLREQLLQRLERERSELLARTAQQGM